MLGYIFTHGEARIWLPLQWIIIESKISNNKKHGALLKRAVQITLEILERKKAPELYALLSYA